MKATGGVELAVYHLDVEGMVMVPLDPRERAVAINQPVETLPGLSGLQPGELQPGRRLETPQVRAALALLEAFEHSPMSGLVDVKKVDVAFPEVLVLTTSQGSEITFSLQDLEQQLRRWREVFDLGHRMSRAIATLDLAVTNNIPARWLEASALPPTAPKSPTPVWMGERCARSAKVRTVANIKPIAMPTPTTSGTDTRSNCGTPGELNNTSPPIMKEATPAVVSAPCVGALISRMNRTKAVAIKIRPNQLTGRRPKSIDCQGQANHAHESGCPCAGVRQFDLQGKDSEREQDEYDVRVGQNEQDLFDQAHVDGLRCYIGCI